MEEKIKEIVSTFIKIAPEEIIGSTTVNRSAVANSIMLHRMYAQLLAAGADVKNYWEVNTFNDLISAVNGHLQNGNTFSTPASAIGDMNNKALQATVGIDIEEVAHFPLVPDFREDAFYQQNFSAEEISYCILQKNPHASFAGLFAAKEAIVKCDNSYRRTSFNSIVISHTSDGKPAFKNIQLSISHTDKNAIAIAIPDNNGLNEKKIFDISSSNNHVSEQSPKSNKANLMALLSLILSIIALAIVFLFR